MSEIEDIKREEIICLNITSWQGISIGAEHYYGELITLERDIEDVEMKRKIEEVSEARYLSKKVGYKGAFKVGDETSCFTTEKQLIKEVRKQYKKHFPKTRMIILGRHLEFYPQKIILGPRNLKKINNVYYKAYENIWKLMRAEGYSDDQIIDVVQPIEDEWLKIWRDKID